MEHPFYRQPPNFYRPGHWSPSPPRIKPKHPRSSLARDSANGVIAGVASGLAPHLGWPTWLLRLSFIALTFTSLAGVALYGLFWLLMPVRAKEQSAAPGITAASHQNMRSVPQPRRRPASVVSALVMIGIGLTISVYKVGSGPETPIFWPFMAGVVGVALIWRQADKASVSFGSASWLADLKAGKGWRGFVWVGAGVALIGASISAVLAIWMGLESLPRTLAIVAGVAAGMLLLALPWLHSYYRTLEEARNAKIVADTRADMAAHLHDSVLQTLALIQLQADDPKTVASLARRQERELRTWLYGDQTRATTLKSALEEAAGAVEDEWSVPVSVVCVSDTEISGDLDAMVRAAREAMTNAAKHSGASNVDVYAEVQDVDDAKLVQIFIRDRGSGFDLDTVADDRQGVRNSIIARMARHGGSADIKSAPAEGTEIRLEMKI